MTRAYHITVVCCIHPILHATPRWLCTNELTRIYIGCLIVEILDFRPARAKEPILERPDKQRVVLRPNPETIWADICILNAKSGAKWSDMDALKVESKLLVRYNSFTQKLMWL